MSNLPLIMATVLATQQKMLPAVKMSLHLVPVEELNMIERQRTDRFRYFCEVSLYSVQQRIQINTGTDMQPTQETAILGAFAGVMQNMRSIPPLFEDEHLAIARLIDAIAALAESIVETGATQGGSDGAGR